MIKARTGIKYLRRLGIVLITMPEAITTPIGVALLLTARYLSQKLEATLYKNLRETIKLYLAQSKPLSDESDDKSSAPRRVKRPKKSEERLVPLQYKEDRSLEANQKPLSRHGRRNKDDDTVHHSVDIKWLSFRFGTANSTKNKSGDSAREAAPDEADKLSHHNIDRQALSRRFKDEPGDSTPEATPDEAAKLTHHNIDRQALSRRFKDEPDDSAPEATLDEATKLTHHNIDKQALSRRFKDEPDDSAPEATPDEAAKLTHHSIDRQKLSQRFQKEDRSEADSNSARTSAAGKETVHHPIKKRLVFHSDASERAQNPETDDAVPVKTKHHTINMASLLKRFGPAAGSTQAPKT